MLFNEFCECTGDLSTSTETEVKKYTKRNILEQRKTRPHGQSEPSPIDRGTLADRSARVAMTSQKRQRHRRSITAR